MRFLPVCAVLAVATLSIRTTAVETPAVDVTRSLHFSAIDAKGAAVTDLQAGEVTVKEGGTNRQVSSLAPASAPLHLSIVVDDGGSGGFQSVLAQFIQGLLKRGQFAITVLSPEPVLLTDFTSDAAALSAAIGRLGGRGKVRPDGDQLVETIAEAASTLQQRKVERPAIFALTVNGEDTDADVGDRILRRLQASGVMLNVMFVTSATTGQVITDGPRQSGGLSEGIGGVGNLGAAMTRIFNHLSSQYVVTYTLPDGVRPADRVAVSTSRKDVKLIAPTHIPNREP
jgi:hypothetical protein